MTKPLAYPPTAASLNRWWSQPTIAAELWYRLHPRMRCQMQAFLRDSELVIESTPAGLTARVVKKGQGE